MRKPRRLEKRGRSLLVEARHDADAFAAFYERYSQRVLVYVAKRVLDAEVAFDLTHEAFAIALERRAQFRGSTAEEEQGWLFAIARNELNHYWRDGKVERAALARMAVPLTELADADIERIEELAGLSEIVPRLGEAMGELPEDQRSAIELRVVAELGYEELAERLGVSQQVARARVSRGLRTLAREVASPDVSLKGAA